MRPSRFDLTSGFFLTLILFLGVIVSMMFLLWTLNRWASQSEIRHSPPVRTTFVDAGSTGSESDFDTPQWREVQELMEPAIEESLISVNEAAQEAARTLRPLGELPERASGAGHSGPDATAGIPEEEDDIVPRFERWQLNFSAGNRQDYAAQLDHFEIELGVIGGGIQGVDIVEHLSTQPQTHRLVNSEQEQRLFFMWTTASGLRDYEQVILTEAGVELEGRVVIRLIPRDLENQLALMELKFSTAAGHESVTDIAKTVFQCKPLKGGFEFRVIDQRYR